MAVAIDRMFCNFGRCPAVQLALSMGLNMATTSINWDIYIYIYPTTMAAYPLNICFNTQIVYIVIVLVIFTIIILAASFCPKNIVRLNAQINK